MSKQTTKQTKTAAKQTKATAKPGVGAWVRSFLKSKQSKDLANAEIAEMARKRFGSATSPACISWYRAHP